MLARRSSITHPIAGKIDLPLLVPAFSSKGFEFSNTGRGKNKRIYSRIVYELADFAGIPSRSMLVSAYDLHHRHFDPPKAKKDQALSYLQNAGVVFLDSGGYELRPDFDLTEPRYYMYSPDLNYSKTNYEKILEKFRAHKNILSLIIANFDHATIGKSIDDQISEARCLFRKNPDFLSDFILKPWTKTRHIVDPNHLSNHDIEKLRGFDIIGVTEKELGNDLMTRLKGIAALRKKLNDCQIDTPIHIWGGLDPIMTPLYFFAGAEIFDGISWLRYAFYNGMSTYRECAGILLSDLGILATRQMNHAYASMKNRNFMEKMENSLQQWVDFEGTKFDMFHKDAQDALEEAYGTMVSKISELKGGK